jgi:hypothetical protein
MTDQEFLQAFEDATLTEFAHRDHIRMAWLYLREYGADVGLVKIREGIQAFARSVGADRKYHETITVFWAQVVALGIVLTPEISEFSAYVEAHPHLLDKALLQRHYSSTILRSELARQTWVEPDLIALPSKRTP